METSKQFFINTPKFTGRNVPITEISKAIGKDAQFIRIGIQKGILKFGFALKKENSIIIVRTRRFGKRLATLKAVFRYG